MLTVAVNLKFQSCTPPALTVESLFLHVHVKSCSVLMTYTSAAAQYIGRIGKAFNDNDDKIIIIIIIMMMMMIMMTLSSS